MKLPIMAAAVALGLVCSAQASAFTDRLLALRKTGSAQEVQRFIKDSYEANKDDPEYFITAANYWWGLSQEVDISAKPSQRGDFVVADQKTGKEVGSISTAGKVNPQLPKAAIALLDEAHGRFPTRLDISIGLAHILKEQAQYDACLQVLEKTLDVCV